MSTAAALANLTPEIDGRDSSRHMDRSVAEIVRKIGRETVFQLQLEQREHDDRYHPEISRLTMHHRLNHMALHFAKYVGRIAAALESGDHRDVNRTLTDIFIIAVSSANILNVDLGQALLEGDELAKEQTARRSSDEDRLIDLLIFVSCASGRMAKACESLDHLEAVPFRQEMTAAIVQFACYALMHSGAHRIDLVNSVRSRLEGVRSGKIFHGHI